MLAPVKSSVTPLLEKSGVTVTSEMRGNRLKEDEEKGRDCLLSKAVIAPPGVGMGGLSFEFVG